MVFRVSTYSKKWMKRQISQITSYFRLYMWMCVLCGCVCRNRSETRKIECIISSNNYAINCYFMCAQKKKSGIDLSLQKRIYLFNIFQWKKSLIIFGKTKVCNLMLFGINFILGNFFFFISDQQEHTNTCTINNNNEQWAVLGPNTYFKILRTQRRRTANEIKEIVSRYGSDIVRWHDGIFVCWKDTDDPPLRFTSFLDYNLQESLIFSHLWVSTVISSYQKISLPNYQRKCHDIDHSRLYNITLCGIVWMMNIICNIFNVFRPMLPLVSSSSYHNIQNMWCLAFIHAEYV